MPDTRQQSAIIRLPPTLVDWIRDMSRRARAPRYRVLQVLIDDYTRRLSPSSRRKLFEWLSEARREAPH
jgi:hypothetical protein